jgi:predicted SAM-dependent methyltransferase
LTESNGIRLDIGCGLRKRDGFLGIDKVPNIGADYVLDVTRDRLPFDDSTVEEIYCGHLVEHLIDFIPFMNECYRVLKPEGRMTILAPYYTAIQATQDPTHVRYINENTFLYFTDYYLREHKTFDNGVKCRFSIESTSYTYINMWGKPWIPMKMREWARHHLFNVVVDITVVLKTIKPL